MGELLLRRVRTIVVVDAGGDDGGVFRGLLEDMRRAQAALDCAFLPVTLPSHSIPPRPNLAAVAAVGRRQGSASASAPASSGRGRAVGGEDFRIGFRVRAAKAALEEAEDTMGRSL